MPLVKEVVNGKANNTPVEIGHGDVSQELHLPKTEGSTVKHIPIQAK